MRLILFSLNAMSFFNFFLAGTRNAQAASLGAFACHERLSFQLLVASDTLLSEGRARRRLWRAGEVPAGSSLLGAGRTAMLDVILPQKSWVSEVVLRESSQIWITHKKNKRNERSSFFITVNK